MSFMRTRVHVDVRKPLKHIKKIEKVRGDSTVASFKYESLSSFSYLSSLLGIIEKFYEKLFTMEFNDVK